MLQPRSGHPRSNSRQKLLFGETPSIRFTDAPPLRGVLRGARLSRSSSVGLLIGPEGDFTREETGLAVEAGVLPARFGPLTMRVETAAVFGLSVLSHEVLSG